jgi:hypothetical protein
VTCAVFHHYHDDIVRFIIRWVMQVRAVSCKGSVSSAVTSKQVTVTTAPAVVVSMTLDGSLSMSQLSSDSKRQLETAVAESMDVQPSLVLLVSFKGSSRRLLGLSLDFQVLATSSANAAALQRKAAAADFAVTITRQTGLNVAVSGVSAGIVDKPIQQGEAVPLVSGTPSVPAVVSSSSVKDQAATQAGVARMNVPLIAGVAGGVGGVILSAFLVFLVIYTYKRKTAQPVIQQELSVASGQLAWVAPTGNGEVCGIPASAFATAPELNASKDLTGR